MEEYLPTYTDITNWSFVSYTNTGGTRSKQIAIHPETERQFFFKGSKVVQETGEIRYPTEFWSEIVSSKIGRYLGFDTLDYNIGFNKNNIQHVGCLSESMIEHSTNRLTEGVTYLTGFRPSYRPALKEHQTQYTFQFIFEALQYFDLEEHINSFIELLILDSIISNSDRHQENWGIITKFNDAINILSEEINVGNNSLLKNTFLGLVRWLAKYISKHHDFLKESPKRILPIQSQIAPHSFAPIYDSGCCLGREIEEDKLSIYFKDNQLFESYINKGVSEVRWEGEPKKLNHFELIRKLCLTHQQTVNQIIERVREKYSKNNIQYIIYNIDQNLPSELEHHKLSNSRKQLMEKIVHSRFEKLIGIL